MGRPDKSSSDPQQHWIRYLGLGTQLLAYLSVAIFGGYLVDHRLHCFPLLTALLPLLVLGAVFYKLIKETGSMKPRR